MSFNIKEYVILIKPHGAIHQFMPEVMPEVMPAALGMKIMPASCQQHFPLSCTVSRQNIHASTLGHPLPLASLLSS
jgi:hypothetical protein